MALFDWQLLLHRCAMAGISPAEFWRLSVCELRVLLEPATGQGGAHPHIRRDELEALMSNFPDSGK